MKRLFAAILCLCLLAGCGGKGSTGDTCGTKDDPAAGTEKVESAGETFRIIQEQPENLLLAKTDGNSADVYTLSLRDVELTLDGNAFDRNEPGAYQSFPDGTRTGALVEVACDLVLETYPGQLAEVTAVNIRSDGFDDRCALYLRVLNDLWAVDEGLNSDITMLSVDLSQTGLSDSEQAAVAWVFGGMHDISETMTMSYEELAAEGYLTGTEPDSDGIPCCPARSACSPLRSRTGRTASMWNRTAKILPAQTRCPVQKRKAALLANCLRRRPDKGSPTSVR